MERKSSGETIRVFVLVLRSRVTVRVTKIFPARIEEK